MNIEEKYPIKWKGYNIRVEFSTYAIDNSTAIKLMSWDEEYHTEMPFAVATVYAEGAELAEDEVVIKNYSENEGIYELLLRNDIIHKSHAKIPLGFTEGLICQLKDKEE